MAKNWIAKATANSHGQFRHKAHSAGLTTVQAAQAWANKPGKLGKQARLAQTLMGLQKRGK